MSDVNIDKDVLPQVGITRAGTNGLLIAYTPKQRWHDNGMWPHGVGLFILQHNDLHPFVVWTIYSTDNGLTWEAESGTYCETIQKGVKAYEDRGGK